MPTSPQKPRFDVARTLEETLFGIILLLWRMARTTWGFLFEPTSFDAQCRESTQSGGDLELPSYTRPLTYLTTSCLVVLTFVYGFTKFVDIEMGPWSTVLSFFAQYLTSFDLIKLVAIVFPGVAAIASYAGLTSLFARFMGCEQHYLTHLSITSYFAGTLILVLPVMLIAQPGLMALGLLGMLTYALGMSALIFRTIYRYLAMLRSLVADEWGRAIGVAVGACLAFGLLSSGIYLAAYLLISSLSASAPNR